MRWGVTYSALLVNLIFTLEAFLLTRNLITLGVGLPIHAVSVLLCARDARYFDLVLLWARTRLPAWYGNLRAIQMPGRSVGRCSPVPALIVPPSRASMPACMA
jgi:hypothetical protein